MLLLILTCRQLSRRSLLFGLQSSKHPEEFWDHPHRHKALQKRLFQAQEASKYKVQGMLCIFFACLLQTLRDACTRSCAWACMACLTWTRHIQSDWDCEDGNCGPDLQPC